LTQIEWQHVKLCTIKGEKVFEMMRLARYSKDFKRGNLKSNSQIFSGLTISSIDQKQKPLEL
jgi:hypothetical protein